MKTSTRDGVRPFLRWAGSKRSVLTFLARFVPGGSRYVEPFAGSAALFFFLSPDSALIGDSNSELIHTLRSVRDEPRVVGELLHAWPNTPSEYYRIRSWDPSNLNPFYRAARFIYLNRFCFNGLYRTNQQGRFNVPYGGARAGARPAIEELVACGTVLKRSQLVQGDFAETLALVETGDFVYLDPPYRSASRKTYGEYGPREFSDSDLLRLRRWIERLDGEGIRFLVSYADTPQGRELAKDFLVHEISVRRNIAGFAGKRRLAAEIVVTNISAPVQ